MKQVKRVMRHLVVIVMAVVLWQLVVQLNFISSHYLASPLQILNSLVSGFKSGLLLSDMGITLERVAIGWLIGSLAGYTIGILVGVIPVLDELFTPLLELLRPVSPVALIPVAILFLGIGNSSKFAIIGFGCFWPVLLNTIAGVKGIGQTERKLASVLHLRWFERFLRVELPGSLPSVFVGLRLAAGIAFVVVVAAEFVGSTNGLGYQILSAEQSFNVPLVYGAIALLAILGFVANFLFVMMERVIIRWRV